jgi:hypothetical protein
MKPTLNLLIVLLLAQPVVLSANENAITRPLLP